MAPPAHELIKPIRPAERTRQLQCCLCNGATVDSKGRVELLAPFEDSLTGMDDGEVRIEEGLSDRGASFVSLAEGPVNPILP